MITQFSRTEMLIGSAGVKKLADSRIAVFGVGGVGGSAAEALVRAGVGAVDIIDNDVVALTNLNRQLVAVHSTIGMKKTEAMRDRLLDINPSAEIRALDVYFDAGTAVDFDFAAYDYVIDAIDTVTSKLLLVEKCLQAGTPIISSMGTGNKVNPALLTVADIYKTTGCPLARVMRRELKKRGIKKLTVVYSPEEPRKPLFDSEESTGRRSVPGTVSFMPPVAGYMLAGKAIRDILEVV